MAASIMAEIDRIWELRDKRTDGFPLMSSPFPTLAICMGYYYVVKVAGPRFMADRKPFELRRVLMVYNLYQIIFNAWLFYEMGMSGWFFGGYNFFCAPVDYTDDENGRWALTVGYCFFISKFIDYFDSFFFVLRKKDSHLSVLHLYHHGLLPIILWPGFRYVCGGHASFFAFLNSLVHVVMYTYYFLAAMGPSVQKFLWWKKYLTTFQMVQFVTASVHCFQVLFQSDCNFPKAFALWIGSHELGYLALFYHFYLNAYRKTDAEKKKAAVHNNNNVENHKKQL